MMAVNVKRRNSDERVWLDQEGRAINVDRAWKKSDSVIAQGVVDARLLKAATIDIEGVRQWFALRTTGTGELDLCRKLTDSRVDAVVPEKKVQLRPRVGARCRKVVHKPVVRQMVFVNLVPSNAAFAGLLRMKGVSALVGKGDAPHPIGDREMNGFMDLAQAGAFDERNAPTGLVVGSRVTIRVGPYADFSGVLEGYAKGRTARVMTMLFGREMTVDVKLAHLEKQE